MTKKPISMIIIVLCTIIAGVLITSLIYAFTGFSVFGNTQRNTTPPEDTENAEMISLAYKVLEYIRDDDFTSLQHLIHPDLGVTFSPYATVNLSTNRQFTSSQISRLNTDTNIYVWGVFNGSGEPIELTPADYFARFVSAAEFINAPDIGVNQIIRSGNALENITETFPDIRFVDFHISRGEPTDETDWSSLRLGFENYNGNLRLIAVVYSSWTI